MMNLAQTLGFQNMIICGVSEPRFNHECGYSDLISLAIIVINNLVVLSTYIVVVSLIFVGFKLMTSQGSSTALKDAKSAGTRIVIGYLIILSAWIVIYTITNLMDPGYSILGAP